MRTVLYLIVGLIIGAVGATLFRDSFPPKPGSEAAKVAALERELTRARRRIVALETDVNKPTPESQKFSRGVHTIVEDFRDGRPVDINNVFQTAKPVLRDLAPIFDAVRRREQKRAVDGLTADLMNKYELSSDQQRGLRKWFEEKAEQEAKRFREFALKDSTGVEDLAKAAKDIRADDGLDAFMERTLSGEKLARFKTDRMAERAERVQQEADRKVDRLNRVVNLDETQQDQVFALMARSSHDFDPTMKLDGVGDDTTSLAPGQSRDDAIMAVLRSEQREQLEAHRTQRRQEAEQQMNEIGLKLPANWDFFEEE